MKLYPALVLSLAVGSGACASNGKLPPVAAAKHSVSEGITIGARNASSRNTVTIPIRYNPAECECPGWEVRAFGRWIRVFLEPTDAPQLAALRESRDPLATAEVTGRFAESSRLSERNVRYPVFAIR